MVATTQYERRVEGADGLGSVLHEVVGRKMVRC